MGAKNFKNRILRNPKKISEICKKVTTDIQTHFQETKIVLSIYVFENEKCRQFGWWFVVQQKKNSIFLSHRLKTYEQTNAHYKTLNSFVMAYGKRYALYYSRKNHGVNLLLQWHSEWVPSNIRSGIAYSALLGTPHCIAAAHQQHSIFSLPDKSENWKSGLLCSKFALPKS